MSESIRFYYSLRSPFAGIAVHRALHSPEFAGVAFEAMPLWPELIFGGHMDNPTDNLFKLAYVFQDAARQAEVAGLDAGFLKALASRFVVPEGADLKARKLGVPMGEEHWEIPHAALVLAREEGRDWALAEALFARRFGFDGGPPADVQKPDVLAEVAESVGLDGAAAASAHEAPEFEAAIAGIVAQGERDGVFGVPFFVLDRGEARECFWGNDHLEYLLRAIRGSDELPVLTRKQG